MKRIFFSAFRQRRNFTQFKLDNQSTSSSWSYFYIFGAFGAAVATFNASPLYSRSRVVCEENNKSIQLGVDANGVLAAEARNDLKNENKFTVNLKDNFKAKYEGMIKDLQDEICQAMSEIDGNQFRKDDWQRENGGGSGRTRVIQDGNVFEKAGVNVSVVHGTLPPRAVQMMKKEHKSLDNMFSNKITGLPFYACGISLVIHPHNPMAPTVHLNYRFFEVVDPTSGKTCWWFGGGSDLTPTYLFENDTSLFHKTLKDACDDLEEGFYDKYKEECDNYFFIKHRNERRGVGGIFFDDLNSFNTSETLDDDAVKEKFMKFQKKCLHGFISSYSSIMGRRKDMSFNEENKRWQQLRRGRYVEFNLVYDRGTKFGLYTPNARIESILMSLPLTCRFEYMHEPLPGSDEDKILKVLKTPRDWINTSHNLLEYISTDDIIRELIRREEAKEEL